MTGFQYSVRELYENGYGPIIGSYMGVSAMPPDAGSLIAVNGKVLRVVAARRNSDIQELSNTILVEHSTHAS